MSIFSNDDVGFWLFSDNGMVFPPIPFAATDSNITSILSLCGIVNDRCFGVEVDDTLAFHGDSFPFAPGKDNFNNGMNNSRGIVLYVGISGQKNIPLSRSSFLTALEKNQLMHPCLWPLTSCESRQRIFPIDETLPPLALQLIPQDIWDQLWAGSKSWFLSRCKIGEIVVELTQIQVANQPGKVTTGALVRREQIPDPKMPYNNKNTRVEVVSITLITIFRGRQRAQAIGHFTQDGKIVRAQVNCYNYGCEEDNGKYFRVFTIQNPNQFQLEEIKL